MLSKTFKPKEGLTSDFTKIESGENRLRILSDFIDGNTYWVTTQERDDKGNFKRKPVYKRGDDTIDVSVLGTDKWGNPETVKNFVAAVVWNYQTHKIEVFVTDKFSIIRDIYDLEQDQDWGDTKQYDISINKNGEEKMTRYKVNPKPGKPVSQEIVDARNKKKIDLTALYRGEMPFETKNEDQKNSGMISEKSVEDITEDIPF